jgi:hypothetical protein
MTTATRHPLRDVLDGAAGGSFPPVDGRIDVLAPDARGVHAVVEFTGHSCVLTDRPPGEVRRRGRDGFGGCTHADVLRWLAGDRFEIGDLDVVLVATGGHRAGGHPDDGHPDPVRLERRTDLEAHGRVVRSRRHRRDVHVFGDERGLVTVGRGLVDRWEVSVELTGAAAGAGAGRSLAAAAAGLVPDGEWAWAQVSPGNAASLRSFLAAGFVPVGSEVLLTPHDVSIS